MEPTTAETEPMAPVAKPLDSHIAEVLSQAAKPLPYGGIKKALKAAGVPLSGKSKVGDDAILAAIDAAIAEGRAFVHPHKKPGGAPAYWHKAHVTKAELLAEKARVIEAKVEEKARAKSAKLDEKAQAKAATVDAKAARKTAQAEHALQLKVNLVGETLNRKVAELGDKPVAPKALGQPKSGASDAEKDAFASGLDAFVAGGQLFRHGDKYGKRAAIVTEWFEVRPLKKPFEEALKAARAIVESGDVDFDELTKVLKAKLNEAPATVPTASSSVDAAPATETSVAG